MVSTTRPFVPPPLEKALEKAAAHGLYLGLDDYAWLDLLESGC